MIKIRKHLQKDIFYRVKWLSNPNVNKFIGDELGRKTNLKKEKERIVDLILTSKQLSLNNYKEA